MKRIVGEFQDDITIDEACEFAGTTTAWIHVHTQKLVIISGFVGQGIWIGAGGNVLITGVVNGDVMNYGRKLRIEGTIGALADSGSHGPAEIGASGVILELE
ncbi:hypothetical protein [Qipengyuania nanhaisediminis]|uniref:Polymer-forming protein n=1 Tax=Qipengyuania nanhaisediminis TaxID=604088 RepID=A0A1I5N354_9SPHN|nr:hypothetical protein [Qipengyuania nanhaisediminis]SFP16345.1 hypothetical protein SAMN04488060_1764 [Qipengyuania nanhaisediminis]